MYLKSILVKFKDGWPWPIFEVTGVNLNMKICNFSLVNTITQQILIALGPNLSHGCISGVSWLSLKMDELDLYVEVIGLISKLNLFLKSVLVKFEDGWPWPIFEVTGQFKHENFQFPLVNTITQQILIALGPNLYHGCISRVSWLSSKMDDLDLFLRSRGSI